MRARAVRPRWPARAGTAEAPLAAVSGAADEGDDEGADEDDEAAADEDAADADERRAGDDGDEPLRRPFGINFSCPGAVEAGPPR